MGSFPMPPGYEWGFGRWNRFQQQSQMHGRLRAGLRLALVYMLMAALFESFIQPLTIMFSVPFALLGVGVVMKLADQPLDTMRTIGLIILMGVVVNNAIVLVDHINSLRQQGMEREEAIVSAGRHRLRPIIITAVTTILGLSPMVAPMFLPQIFGPLEGRAGTWAPIGLVIMGGLTTSTFLTLVIIPTLYSLMDDMTNFFKRVAARYAAGPQPRRSKQPQRWSNREARKRGSGPAGPVCSVCRLWWRRGRGRCADRGGGSRGSGGGMAAMMGGGPPGGDVAVPVEVATVERRSISSFIETNGTLEAENEVDIVARVAGPIVRLEAEETMLVRRGDLLARIDPSEIEAQREIARVALDEARLACERAERLKQEELVSAEDYENAKAAFESAQAQFEGNEIELGYTEIRAPFDGLIIDRFIKFAQHVGNGDPLFRISDFDPLLCRIQVPERNLPVLRTGQRAHLTVEAWPGERFEAHVLRLSPVVDSSTGTVG